MDAVDASDDETALAQRLLVEWDHGKGTSKSEIERRIWGDGAAHGRRFDRFVRQQLGIATTRPSKQTDRIGDLERQLRRLGVKPDGTEFEDWEQHLHHARQACLAALRVWNDPTASFRTETFSLLFVAAWNRLAIAILQKGGEEWRELDSDGHPKLVDGRERALDTVSLVESCFSGSTSLGLRLNVRRWIDLRNLVAHRNLPALDLTVIPFAQAGLVNFEEALGSRFGSDYLLSDALSVPLQLSGFHDPGVMSSLKKFQASLPLDVQHFLADSAESDISHVDDPTFMLRVTFIPVGRTRDGVQTPWPTSSGREKSQRN